MDKKLITEKKSTKKNSEWKFGNKGTKGRKEKHRIYIVEN
jgi:hypothetical protein